MLPPREQVTWLYLANVTLLATHQVDAAYWEEWDTFRLPVGIDFFLAFNVAALVPVLIGFREVARWGTRARLASGLLAAVGGFVVVLHAVVLALGNDDFRSASSLTILGAILLVSVAQGWATRRVAAG